jgi:hypothetical protein
MRYPQPTFLTGREKNTYYVIHLRENCHNLIDIYFTKVFFFRSYDMLAMLPRLKTAPPH